MQIIIKYKNKSSIVFHQKALDIWWVNVFLVRPKKGIDELVEMLPNEIWYKINNYLTATESYSLIRAFKYIKKILPDPIIEQIPVKIHEKYPFIDSMNYIALNISFCIDGDGGRISNC
jgi:hypothetical protein